jgi:putative membrane protein
MFVAAASVNVWRFQVHPEVWLLVGSLIGLYTYAVRVIGPKVVPEGEPVLTRRQLIAAISGITLLWVASDWPMHDIGEQYLYAVHMLQHSLLTLAVPALALIATPRWLADLILGQGKVRRVVRTLSLPVVAGIAYNAMVMAVHWPALVNASVSNGLLHYGVHTLLVGTALMMWMPVCGPIREWRISAPAQMVYLFLMSVIPTVPGGWLTFADHAVYSSYDNAFRAFDISVRTDQQAAGVLMKLGAGGGLWVVITIMFFKWAFTSLREEDEMDRLDREAAAAAGASPDDERAQGEAGATLTYDQVSKAFARTDPAPEPHAHRRR